MPIWKSNKKLSYQRDGLRCVKLPFEVIQGHPLLCQSTLHVCLCMCCMLYIFGVPVLPLGEINWWWWWWLALNSNLTFTFNRSWNISITPSLVYSTKGSDLKRETINCDNGQRRTVRNSRVKIAALQNAGTKKTAAQRSMKLHRDPKSRLLTYHTMQFNNRLC